MPSPTSPHSKSKVIYKATNRERPSEGSVAAPAFSAANASLQNLSDPHLSDPRPETLELAVAPCGSETQHAIQVEPVEVATPITAEMAGLDAEVETGANADANEPVAAIEPVAETVELRAKNPAAEDAAADQHETSSPITQILSVEIPATQEMAPVVSDAGVEPVLELAPQFAAPDKAETASPVVAAKPSTQGVLPREVVRDANAHRGHKSRSRNSRRSRRRPAVWLGAGLGGLLLVAGGAAAGAYSSFASGQTIAPNVFIAGVSVGGLTLSAAKARLTSHFGKPSIALVCDQTTVEMPIEKLGARLSIEPTVRKAFSIGRDGFLPNNLLRVYGSGANSKNFMLPIEWNKTQLLAGLSEANKKIAIKPVDARLRAATVGLEVVPDRQGRELDAGVAAHLLQRKFFIGMPSLHVPSRSVQAKVSARDLDGRDVQLAQYTTRFNAGLAGRTENIRIACRAIQNHVLMPGETFSFNACTGERTAPKGYRMAHIFQRQPGAAEAEVVDGLAGGVCQVSSTLFNAVRKTNAATDVNPIKIVERSSHSLPVTYVPHGLDATVAWPYKDFKFRNITDHPVYVRTSMGRSKLSIAIWGRIPRA